MLFTCGHCGVMVQAEVVQTGRRFHDTVHWLQCPACADGSVMAADGTVWPPAPAGALVPNLPADVGRAWREARSAHAVAAYTAAEIMCRKILMHLAVDKASAKVGKNFMEYVDVLDSAGFVAPGLKPVVDQIRTRGNVANHELPASSEPDSLTTMKITEHLLRTIYELPGLITAPTP